MNAEESLKICSIIKVAYPNSCKDFSKDDVKNMVALWTMQFADIPYNYVSIALNTFISTNTSGFPPTIAQIKEIIYDQSTPNKLNDIDAWLLVRKACRNSLYHSDEEYAKLPPIVQKVVGSASVLRQYAMCESREMQFIETQFKKDYKTAVQRERENACLPLNIKKAIGVSDTLRLEGDKK